VTSAGSGQLSPAAWKRLSVARTVDAATPIRRAISRVGTPPTNFNRRTSRTWRMVVLSAGIRSLLWNSQRSGPESASRGTRHPGRDHLGMVGDIISEWRARSSRNGGRHHSGISNLSDLLWSKRVIASEEWSNGHVPLLMHSRASEMKLAYSGSQSPAKRSPALGLKRREGTGMKN
jgi:hypothetical protein